VCAALLPCVSPGWGLSQSPSDVGVITLKGYVTFWGWVFAAVTIAVALFKHESDHYEEAARAKRTGAAAASQPAGAAAAL